MKGIASEPAVVYRVNAPISKCHGTLDPELSEDAAKNMNANFTKKRAIAQMMMTTVCTSTGTKKPTFELTALQPFAEQLQSSKEE